MNFIHKIFIDKEISRVDNFKVQVINVLLSNGENLEIIFKKVDDFDGDIKYTSLIEQPISFDLEVALLDSRSRLNNQIEAIKEELKASYELFWKIEEYKTKQNNINKSKIL